MKKVWIRDVMEWRDRWMGAGDIPSIVRATNAFLRAGLMRSIEVLPDDLSEFDLVLIRHATQFIDVNLQRADLTPEKISDAIGISRARPYKILQGSGGIVRQVQRQRLSRAYDVLTDPDMPKERIAQVVRRHGFVDEKYFSRIFRATFGCTQRDAMERRHVARFRPRAATSSVSGPSFVQWLKAEEAKSS